jgi:hypothetical protein
LSRKERDGKLFTQRLEMQQQSPRQQGFVIFVVLAILVLNAWYFFDLQRQRQSSEPFRLRSDDEDEGKVNDALKIRRKGVALMISFPNSVCTLTTRKWCVMRYGRVEAKTTHSSRLFLRIISILI